MSKTFIKYRGETYTAGPLLRWSCRVVLVFTTLLRKRVWTLDGSFRLVQQPSRASFLALQAVDKYASLAVVPHEMYDALKEQRKAHSET